MLTGNWGFPLQFRRPLTCVLQSTYKWAESLPEKVCCRIPPTVFDELLALSLLVNHAYTDSQRINPVVSATDASSTGLGACEVTVSEQLSKKLFLRTDLRGERTTLGGVLLPTATPAPRIPRGLHRKIYVAVHMFSGPRRAGDVHHWWTMIASIRGIEIAIEDYGICILMQHDLTQHAFFVWILWRAEHGQIHWLLGGPPCGT